MLLLIPAHAGKVDAAKIAATVILDETGVKNLKIETVEAEETDFEETVFVLGRIEAIPAKRAVVSSRVPGRVISVAAHIDRPIEKDAEALVLESRQPGDPPPSVRLTAPISGLITAVHAVPGLPVEQKDSLVEIVDLSEVHAVANVPEHLIGKLKPGQQAHIRVSAHPGQDFTAELTHLGATADTANNTLEAAFHMENPGMLLRPGMRAEFSIVLSKRAGVMSIPRSALQGDATNRFVYIADYGLKNAFVKTPVVIGAVNDRFVEIASGLIAGDEVVTHGAYSLAFAGKGSVSLKDAMDAAHGHPHNEDGSEVTAEQKAKAASATSGGGAAQGGASVWTKFFAATSAVLLVLLACSPAFRRKGTPSSN